MIVVWGLVLAKPQIMGKLQGTRNSHFVASKIPKLRLIFSWEKKKGEEDYGISSIFPNEKTTSEK